MQLAFSLGNCGAIGACQSVEHSTHHSTESIWHLAADERSEEVGTCDAYPLDLLALDSADLSEIGENMTKLIYLTLNVRQ